MPMELTISNIQTGTLHDGPGVRTTVFLAGCPLRCLWCHNPETQSMAPTLTFDVQKCTHCGICATCPSGVHAFTPEHTIVWDKCTRCGQCVAVCPQGALGFSSRALTVEEYDALVKRQARLVGDQGGITFSGGEPLLQGENLLHFLERTSLHTAIETCGYADQALFREVIDAVDYVMFDLKIAHSDTHRLYTGVHNHLILDNLEWLRRCGKPYLLRTPLIPGITDTQENLTALAHIVGDSPWETLPYNPLTPAKYDRIGRPYIL